jgi:hypothetical protein
MLPLRQPDGVCHQDQHASPNRLPLRTLQRAVVDIGAKCRIAKGRGAHPTTATAAEKGQRIGGLSWRPRPSCFDLPRGHHAGTKRPRMYALSVQRWSGVRRTYRIEPSRSKGRPDPSTPVGAGVALLRAGPFAYICSRESEAEARRAKNDEGRDATDPPVNAAA